MKWFVLARFGSKNVVPLHRQKRKLSMPYSKITKKKSHFYLHISEKSCTFASHIKKHID